MKRQLGRVGVALTAVLAVAAPTAAFATGEAEERKQFVASAIENTTTDQATLRLQKAIDKDGEWARYVVTESSNRADAERRGVNWSPKLANARGTTAVQRGWLDWRGVLHVEDTVDFTPTRVVTPGPGGFPPAAATPGAVGQARYSPLVQLPNGTVINAPHIQNASGEHDKLVKPIAGRYATFQETEGFYEGKDVYYVSFEASAPDIAALEGATYAPNLNAAPGLGSNERSSARSGIAPFVNGQTGVDNPNRQGLNSALLGEGDPLNVVESRPRQKEYSPLWDVHAAVWTDTAISSGQRVLQDDFESIEKLADGGAITGPGGSFDAIGAIVNCPVISIEK